MSGIRFTLSLNLSLLDAWSAWTNENKITSWFSPEANIEPHLGGLYELFFDPNNHGHQSTKGCRINVFEPMRRLGFTWKGPDQFSDLMNKPNSLTRVLVKFTHIKDRTLIEVEHWGWGDSRSWIEAKKWHKRAWEEVLAKLKSVYSSDDTKHLML